MRNVVDEGSCSAHCRKLAFSVVEAALQAGIGRDAIYRAIRESRLEARKHGRRTLITYDALRRFLDELQPLQLPTAQSK